jgi:acyl dehydratase
MKFADFKEGHILHAGPVKIHEEEILEFAKKYDPQWFHTEVVAAKSGPYGGLIASGWHTCCIAMRLAADTFLKGSESSGSPGLAYVRWPHPVRPGDELMLQVTILETRRSKSKVNTGIVRWKWQLISASNIEVLDLEATSFFDLK